MSEPFLPAAPWPTQITQAATPANENALRLQILASLVISKATTAQPGTPADGDVYIIPAGATGTDWATFAEHDVAIYREIGGVGAWYAFTPHQGLVLNVAGTLEAFDTGTGWAAIAGGGTAAGTTYDNTSSGLAAGDVQAAIDELAGGSGGAATGVSYDNSSSGLAATNVQAAIDEIAASSGGGGGISPLETFLNPLSGQGVVITDATATEVFSASSGPSRDVIAVIGKGRQTTGKFYCEFKFTGAVGSTQTAVGVLQHRATSQLGGSVFSSSQNGSAAVIAASGNKYSGSSASYGSAFPSGAVIMMAVDLAAGKIWWGANGSWYASGDPAAGTNQAYATLQGMVFPAVDLVGTTCKFRGKAAEFDYSPPSGFSGWLD